MGAKWGHSSFSADLNQLTDFARGVLSDTNSDGILDTVASPSRTQAWDLDAMGNWQSLATNGTGQSRTHNAQNQVIGVGSASLTFDANGSMTTDQNGNTFTYDAWNRLVEAVDGSSVTRAEYAYDALGRRIVESRPVSSTTDHLYYSTGWQVLEERRGGTASSDVRRQYLWSIDYVDAMAARVDYASGSVTAKYDVTYDANWNVTAIMVNTNSGASIQERYIYDPYGAVTILAPNGTVRSSSSYDWKYLHQTGRLDGDTGLYHFRNRDYSPTLGRWTQTDPIGFEAGDTNLYRYVGNGPVNGVDPSGLDRYITDPLSHLHMGVTVDLWRCNPQTGEYYVIGQKSFDFKAGFPYIPGLIVGPGQIDIREGHWIPESRRITIPSNWKEDQELLQQLEQDAKSPPLYSITMYNCRNYAIQSVFKGIEYRSIDRPRPKNPRDEPVTMDDRRNRREQH